MLALLLLARTWLLLSAKTAPLPFFTRAPIVPAVTCGWPTLTPIGTGRLQRSVGSPVSWQACATIKPVTTRSTPMPSAEDGTPPVLEATVYTRILGCASAVTATPTPTMPGVARRCGAIRSWTWIARCRASSCAEAMAGSMPATRAKTMSAPRRLSDRDNPVRTM
jgi:hypothetical protein